MKDFDKYLQRSQKIASAARASGNGLGFSIAWLMIVVGVLVTAIQTHSLSYNGMRGSDLYEDWLAVAAWLPVVLLEGTAVGLTLGRLYFFKGTEQRRIGHVASFVVWGVLAFNTIARFAVGNGAELPAPLLFYVRYVLPLSIVAVPYLWKWLLDLHPESQERIVALEVEAEYDQQWRAIQREQNEQLIAAYRNAMDRPEVKRAVDALVEKAALKRATQIVGVIDESATELRHDYQRASSGAAAGGYVNGLAQDRPAPKETRH